MWDLIFIIMKEKLNAIVAKNFTTLRANSISSALELEVKDTLWFSNIQKKSHKANTYHYK